MNAMAQYRDCFFIVNKQLFYILLTDKTARIIDENNLITPGGRLPAPRPYVSWSASCLLMKRPHR